MLEPFISYFPRLSLKSEVVQPYIVEFISPMNSKVPLELKTYLKVEPPREEITPVERFFSLIDETVPFVQVPTIPPEKLSEFDVVIGSTAVLILRV